MSAPTLEVQVALAVDGYTCAMRDWCESRCSDMHEDYCDALKRVAEQRERDLLRLLQRIPWGDA